MSNGMKKERYYQTPYLFRVILYSLTFLCLVVTIGLDRYLEYGVKYSGGLIDIFHLSILLSLGLTILSIIVKKLYVTCDKNGIRGFLLKQMIHWNEIETINTQSNKIQVREIRGLKVTFYIYNETAREKFLSNFQEHDLYFRSEK